MIQAANILFAKEFPSIQGLEDTLYIDLPNCRGKRRPVAANIFFVGSRHHYVAGIYAAPNKIHYYDSLKPGSRPAQKVLEQFLLAFDIKKGEFQSLSFYCQKQNNVDCVVYSTANIWYTLKGLNPSSITFTEDKLRHDLLKSFAKGILFFPYKKCAQRRNPKIYKYKLQ